jgi:hypothetical protein
MTKQVLFLIWVIGIYLKFGPWDLVLSYGYALTLPALGRRYAN